MSDVSDVSDDLYLWPGHQWLPDEQALTLPDVDWSPPDVVGILHLPDGSVLYVEAERPPFGFNR